MQISFSLFQAYRLKKCPPPPAVENAEVIYEDEDFHIGKNLRSHGDGIPEESSKASEWHIFKILSCIREPKKVRPTVQPSLDFLGSLIGAWSLTSDGCEQGGNINSRTTTGSQVITSILQTNVCKANG